MKEQFFGKVFWLTLIFQAIIFALAIFVFKTTFVLPVLMIIGFTVFILTLKHLEWGIAIAFAELFAHSHGHIFSATIFDFSLSLRMVIFIAVLSAWLVLVFLKKSIRTIFKDKRLIPFLPLAYAVFLGFIFGLIHNNPKQVFDDGNAYFYFLYIFPVLSIVWNSQKQRMLLQLFAGSSIWVVIVTLSLLFIFTHFPEWQLSYVYEFIRDTRTGELTRILPNIFRIFLQAQFSVLVFFFLILSFLWFTPLFKNKSLLLQIIILSFLFSVILISLSRSFWVGLIAGGFVFIILFLIFIPFKFKQLLEKKAVSVASFIFSLLILLMIIFFPYPVQQGISSQSFTKIFSDRTESDVAISSRWKLLGPMVNVIKKQPILGHGFGTEIEYETDDPRIREQDQTGLQRTYAFEWGWLEVMVKMGFIGLIGFIVLGLWIIRGFIIYLHTEKAWLAAGCIASLIMLYITHIFSPYLNHPLGIGFILFLLPFIHETIPLKPEIKKTLIDSATKIIKPTSKTFNYPIRRNLDKNHNHE
ncbi:hypothetical protein CO172_00535 [Candidatus Uhrbacteria bacterium CG_4_9_14_3_um_filter_36_7]|uniref:O-antigen ligase-related domain-containing protein n=1 Tax=Candidatus Uhrbacteria bacterium CG_4_9_14_3_um_filter_36_7 TaxID=1975033 RepID=A0A2M7XIA5_9BACT|nr:MAG: hypothetical protein CO172_00535 [Candidatus Uhrbacteria bacterium CG_4_9_14_3_um_filter_36_7]